MIDIKDFRDAFTEYSDATVYPDAMIEMQAEISKTYLCRSAFTDKKYKVCLYLMLAHVLLLRDLQLSGQTEILISKLGNEGDVSVSLATPPVESTFSYWLSTSTYGLQLLSLIEIQSIGGFYIGGLEEREGFRKYGGGF